MGLLEGYVIMGFINSLDGERHQVALMAETPGEPVTRERFLDVVWGYTAFPTTRTVDNHIASLRSKLERDPEEPRWIKTVHGIGYKLEL